MNRGLSVQDIPAKVETPCYCEVADAPVSAITDGWLIDGGATLYLFVYCAAHHVTRTISLPARKMWA